MGIFSSLGREQKQSAVLLQAGTFLEYFDLMLYIHMAVILNELFFPKSDPQTAALLSAFVLCTTFVFRPIGALIFGWIGDHIGRKSTIIITTIMMAVSCLVMANLPTYAQIGVASAWIMIICRIAQGMSSMGEIMGAEVYLTETINIPARYPIVSTLAIAADMGGFVALGIVTLVLTYDLNWRIAFWVGASIAIFGAFARTRLRETPVFLEAKRQWLIKGVQEMNLEYDPVAGKKFNETWKEPIQARTLTSYFLIFCGWPLCFYLGFLYFNPMLTETYGYSHDDIIRHNFYLSIVPVVSSITLTYLSCFFHPIRILKVVGTLMLLLMIVLPYLIMNAHSPVHIFLIQLLILLVPLSAAPADAVFISHFPIYRRVTFSSFLYAVSRALMFIVTSFGLIFLGRQFGHFGIWAISLPITVAYLYGLKHFEGLERKRHLYPHFT
ncbi:MAG: MFS transporter [Alphaproteobacteria bacterium]|jgi:MHS family proline/betaine transporter-like MFS transporter|nr:MFS transporter [Alphaproteobacteria bacterium]